MILVNSLLRLVMFWLEASKIDVSIILEVVKLEGDWYEFSSPSNWS